MRVERCLCDRPATGRIGLAPQLRQVGEGAADIAGGHGGLRSVRRGRLFGVEPRHRGLECANVAIGHVLEGRDEWLAPTRRLG